MLKSARAAICLANFVKTPSLIPVKRFFASDLSLDKLYPNSSLKITTPNPVSFSLLWTLDRTKTYLSFLKPPKSEKFNGYIPLKELEVTYSRSSGPGGQNVNVVNTKVDLRFKFENVTFIPEDAKKRLMEEVTFYSDLWRMLIDHFYVSFHSTNTELRKKGTLLSRVNLPDINN